MSAALLIIDMQNGCREDCLCKSEFDSAIQYINEAAGLFRAKQLPVIIVQDVEVGGGPGSPGFEFVSTINRADTDIVVHKQFCNAFWKTRLEEILHEHNVEFVVISGFAAEYCVVFSYNGAVERGFKTSLLQHGVAGCEVEEIKRIQLLRPVISLQALEYLVDLT